MLNNNVEKLKSRVSEIRPILCSSVSPHVLKSITAHHLEILSSGDSQLIAGYLGRATDAECLCALSQMSLSAPLNDTYYKIFIHLAAKVLPMAGVDLPEDLDIEDTGLSSLELRELDELRRSLRKSQRRAQFKGVFQ